jgi:hypothetical protein
MLLKKAEETTAFGKLGVLGFPKTGKTTLLCNLAIGLHKQIDSKGAVCFFDTEKGSDFWVRRFKEAKIPLLATKTRSFTDLMQFMEEAQKEGEIVIIDSITHVWHELLKAKKKALKRKWLTMLDIVDVKDVWQEFTDIYVLSRLHVNLAGRAGYIWDMVENEKGKKELTKTGIKMKVESEMGYEPDLIVQMHSVSKGEGNGYDYVAEVQGDRTNTINGQEIVNPTFEDFLPFYQFISIGGDHQYVDTESSSEEKFQDEGESAYYKDKKQKEQALEEIGNRLAKRFPGGTGKDKVAKLTLIEWVFGFTSWKKVEALPVEQLVYAESVFKDVLGTTKLLAVILENEEIRTGISAVRMADLATDLEKALQNGGKLDELADFVGLEMSIKEGQGEGEETKPEKKTTSKSKK